MLMCLQTEPPASLANALARGLCQSRGALHFALERSMVLERPLAVAFIHPDLGLGGAERLVVDAALELSARGHAVSLAARRLVLCSSPPASLPEAGALVALAAPSCASAPRTCRLTPQSCSDGRTLSLCTAVADWLPAEAGRCTRVNAFPAWTNMLPDGDLDLL